MRYDTMRCKDVFKAAAGGQQQEAVLEPGPADQFRVNKDFWNIALEHPKPFSLV